MIDPMTGSGALKVLIVEDEPAQMEIIVYNLKAAGFQPITASDGEEALLIAEEQSPDLVVLDWMLPELPGIEVCRRLRRDKRTSKIPIIMLTARAEDSDKVRGLETGADDYLVKPYSVAELVARARALIRRSSGAGVGGIFEYAGVKLDTEKVKVTREGGIIKLGPTEFRLLSVLISRPGRVWPRAQLIDLVWDHDSDIDERTVDVHIGRLRRALMKDDFPDIIRTVRSVGYSMDAES